MIAIRAGPAPSAHTGPYRSRSATSTGDGSLKIWRMARSWASPRGPGSRSPTTTGLYFPGMTTMLGPLRRAVAVAGDSDAVTCGDVRLTYSETWERCRRLVGAL